MYRYCTNRRSIARSSLTIINNNLFCSSGMLIFLICLQCMKTYFFECNMLSFDDIATLLGGHCDAAPSSYVVVKDFSFVVASATASTNLGDDEGDNASPLLHHHNPPSRHRFLADWIYEDLTTLRTARKGEEGGSGGGKSLLRPARMSRGDDIWADDYFRGDSLCWINSDLIKEYNLHGLGRFMELIQETVAPLKSHLGLNDDFTVQFAVYPGKGEGYNRHKDAFPKSPTNDSDSGGATVASGRQLTCLFYLNKEWEPEDGGQLRVFTPKGAFIEGGGNSFDFWGCHGYDIEPVLGRLVIFRSEIVEHAVLPCHRERMALTVWITGTGPLTNAEENQASSAALGLQKKKDVEESMFAFIPSINTTSICAHCDEEDEEEEDKNDDGGKGGVGDKNR